MKILFLGLCLFISSLGLVVYAAETGSSRQNVIILLGPPGSGKGTQAVKLSKELKIPHISTGDLFRENISKNTELGRKAKAYMDSGKLVPDDLVLDMVYDRVSQSDCKDGYLLDGFPRTIPQAEALDKYLKNANLTVLNLEVPDEVILKRIAGRLSCKTCGNVHHKDFSPSKVLNKCDKCGGELATRKDDQPEVVKERLRVYQTQTEPLVEYYTKQGKLISVDGVRSPEVVFKDLLSAYNKRS